MAVITYPAKRANKTIEIDTNYATCCGLHPESLAFKNKHVTDIALYCRNPNCVNHEQSVFEIDSHIAKKWEKYRNKSAG